MPRWVPALSLLVGLSGCAVTLRGLVEPAADGPVLVEPDGRTWALQLDNERADLLRYLDGEGVELSGARWGRRVKVRSWSLEEGTHGLQIFMGVLQTGSRGLVVRDEVTGAPVLLDDDVEDELLTHVGRVVLLEGYVEGAQAVRVVYYRVLADLEASE